MYLGPLRMGAEERISILLIIRRKLRRLMSALRKLLRALTRAQGQTLRLYLAYTRVLIV